MPNRQSYLVAGKRSPVGRFLGTISKMTAIELGTQVAKALISEAQADPSAFDEVFVGQV